MKAKLIDGTLHYAPKMAKVDNTDFIPPTEEWLKKNGYKEVEYTEMPQDDNQYASSWKEEKDKIVQVWTISHKTNNMERRERAYETKSCIEYQGETITVDMANKLVIQYEIENIDMTDLKEKIHSAKEEIRAEYPEEN